MLWKCPLCAGALWGLQARMTSEDHLLREDGTGEKDCTGKWSGRDRLANVCVDPTGVGVKEIKV